MQTNLSVEKRFSDIEYNLETIRKNIDEAARLSGRKADDITLMAVTKTVEPLFINHALKNGVSLIGENKVQELLSKYDYLELDGVDCHIIGHLQTNKVRQVLPFISTVESLDSLKLAREISKQAEKLGKAVNCFVEVNIAGEESKSGVAYEEAYDLITEAASLPYLNINGLMCVPPFEAEKDELYAYFKKMHGLFIDIKGKNIDNINMEYLSMGMTGDYRDAIICGANLVRIGSGVFGPRIY